VKKGRLIGKIFAIAFVIALIGVIVTGIGSAMSFLDVSKMAADAPVAAAEVALNSESAVEPAELDTTISPTAVKNLDVPYIRQVGDTSDYFNGSCACGATSAVMIAASYGRLPSHPMTCTFCTPTHTSYYGWYVGPYSGSTPTSYSRYGFTFDVKFTGSTGCQIDPVGGAYGYIHYNDNLAKPYYARNYFWKHGLFSEVIFNPSEATVKSEIDEGHPVWASTTFYGGHIVVIKGYSGTNYYVNDPWPYGYDYCYMGNDMLYSWSEMGVGSKWIVTTDPITVGDRVTTLYDGIKVRNGPGIRFDYAAPERNAGDTGTIVSDSTYGPFYNSDDASRTDYHTWIKVRWDSDGEIGWSAIGYGYTRLGGTSAGDVWIEKITGDQCPYSCWDRSALSGDELAALVRTNFPLGAVTQTGESIRVTAYAIAKAESGGNPSACGPVGEIGLWQIHPPSHPSYDECLLFEEDYNANAAKEISNNGNNWNPWCTYEETCYCSVCTETYSNYLTEARKHFYPKVTSLSVSQASIGLGDSVTIYYSISDDVGLSRVELWRAVDVGGVPDWPDEPEQATSLSGQTSYSGSFFDAPGAAGIYWYGIHVVDNSGAPEAWNDERNSRTGNWPEVCGPDRVEVTAPLRTITFYTDPTNGGTITFDGSTYSNGQSTTKIDGGYSVSASPASNYVFDHWSTTGGVSVSNPNSQSTTATVSGTGSIKAWFIYTITEVDISVVLQGGSRPEEGWEVPITIKFFSPGADVITDPLIEQFDLTTTKSDSTAVCQCTVAPGTYDITAVSEHTLINVKRDVVISTPSTAVNMGTLLEGNANDDSIINISDFGILAVSYMKMEGEPGYDARVDFDRNGIINLSDFGLLAVNYMKMSPIDIA
jgi:hypothetical protein